jgi:hypothetical protein
VLISLTEWPGLNSSVLIIVIGLTGKSVQHLFLTHVLGHLCVHHQKLLDVDILAACLQRFLTISLMFEVDGTNLLSFLRRYCVFLCKPFVKRDVRVGLGQRFIDCFHNY